MIGSPSLLQGMPSGGIQPSTMSQPWSEPVSLAYPMLWRSLVGKSYLFLHTYTSCSGQDKENDAL